MQKDFLSFTTKGFELGFFVSKGLVCVCVCVLCVTESLCPINDLEVGCTGLISYRNKT